jgi:hyperosmotically inducible periplasmic protein
MTPKLTTALFAIGTLLVPAAYAAGTTDTKSGSPPTSRTEKVKESAADAAITTKVKAAFAKDRQVSALKIHVDTDNGMVRLSGNAKSQAEADKAVQIAKETKDVVSVVNDIKIGG